MTTKNIFTFTAPDGTILKRTSIDRTYTHAILYTTQDGAWKIGSCVGRPDLIAARLAYWQGAADNVVAVPAN